MTAKLPPADIRIESDAAGIHAMLELAHAGLVDIPAEMTEAVTTAARLHDAATEQGRHHRELEQTAPERGAQDRAIEAAQAGKDPRPAAAFVHQHRQAVADALEELRVLQAAARETARHADNRDRRQAFTAHFTHSSSFIVGQMLSGFSPRQELQATDRFAASTSLRSCQRWG